jgi:hypothetical protein
MKLTLTTQEERDLYSDMQRKLWEHSRYEVRKEYYPLKMDLWEADRTAIETSYRSKILKIQKEVKAKKLQENKELEKKQEEEEILNAAQILISLSKTKNKTAKTTTSATTVEPLRRSRRLATKTTK